MLVHVIHLDDQCHPSLKSDTLLIGIQPLAGKRGKEQQRRKAALLPCCPQGANREIKKPYFHAVHRAPTEK